MRHRSLVPSALAAVCAAVLAPLAQAAAGTVMTYPIPGTSAPYGIAAGPDGRIWFTDPTYRQIGRMATNGSIGAGDLLGTPGTEPADFITAGPDSDMWAGGAAHVFKVPTDATSTSDIVSYGPHAAGGITTGPDGRLWFTYVPDPGSGANYLGAITTAGSEIDYQVGSAGSPQYISDGIATGSDGKLWLGYDDAIARMSRTGVIGSGDVFPLPAPAASVPNQLALGPDGNVWFTEGVPAAVGKITPSGQITLFETPTASSLPYGIAAGPDGRMWFAERNADKIGAIPTDATSGTDITEYPIGGTNVGAINIAAGPDGRMWFNETNTGSLGAITTGSTTASTSTTEPGQTTTTSTPLSGMGTTSTLPVVPTTSTTLPCRTARCLLDDGLHASACAGETIPAAITKSLDLVTSVVGEAGGAPPKRAKRLIKHAEHALTQAENAAKKATKGKKPKLTVGCAEAIHQAAEAVRSSLPR
jgi:streptogramin lyase